MGVDFGGNIVELLGPVGLDSGQGTETASKAAAGASREASALSQLQWQRQMMGLQGALGYVGGLQQLYNSLYGPGGGMAAPGGMTMGPKPADLMSLSDKDTQAEINNKARTGKGWQGPIGPV